MNNPSRLPVYVMGWREGRKNSGGEKRMCVSQMETAINANDRDKARIDSVPCNAVTCQLMGLGELLSCNLQIPNYQRGYCWKEAQIKSLLDALWHAEFSKPYHLGTIIVHSHDGQLDIVDGLQRLLTLSMIEHWLGRKQASNLLHSKTDDLDMLRNVYQASVVIREWIAANRVDENGFDAFLHGTAETGMCVTLVIIHESEGGDGNLPLAWTFFDAINSGGKRLSDYDLLKAFHLRYLVDDGCTGDDLKAYQAQKWDEMSQSGVFPSTLGGVFYLCRKWLRNRPVQIVESPADARYEVLNHYRALESFSQVNCAAADLMQGIVGGKNFFDWSEYFIGRFKHFMELDTMVQFRQVPWKPQQGHLLEIIKAVVFFFYCRFGGSYLPDALIFTIYRLAKLRNERLNVKNWYNSPLVKHTIEAIDESPTPEYYFHYCQMPSNRYAIHYNLKDESKDSKLLQGWRHGPEFWKRFLGFASSSNGLGIAGIGRKICFKEKMREMLENAAKDFGWAFDEELTLTDGNKQ